MNHLVIYAHPNPASINHTLKETVVAALTQAGHSVVVRDLNTLNFNPVLSLQDLEGQRAGTVAPDVAAEQQHIQWAGCITFIYPIWWTGLPAILKGYIDRVFSYGFAYKYDKGVQMGLLKGKKAIIINTHGKSQQEYEALGMDKALSLTSDTGIYTYCGFDIISHLFFDGADRATPEKIAKWQQQIIQVLK
ncbi:NAD(P)H-dependent oxidoreductase [Flavobacterium subsaxonicum]|uniref:NAD(P)H dehydrogenase n=1 Tax=Flavobacterium subsaxonicum WB 4.1-42 = DSM 21790 TaxID=1121898 RepID=A0A0A2MPI5_9FLAO|nr:NAD(P)H-dependent oxidoreductase [Flavobacterium subsaxonicum]KGO94214.1 NAD(P)H dehydrogenase [Flavobacterium subsaxonicum WB 4.1-42 = DSM 21790]